MNLYHCKKFWFQDNEFDVEVSCLTFHEVKDEKDKIKVLKESFRVLKPNGIFLYLDLFKDIKKFKEYSIFTKKLQEIGLANLEFQDLRDTISFPKFLFQGKILGNAVIVKGKK